MLMQRVLTALVLVPLLVAAIWLLPNIWLYAVFSGVGMLIAWEWAGLMKWTTPWIRLSYAIMTGVLLALAWVLRFEWMWLCGLSLVWWAYAYTLVRGYPANFSRGGPGTQQMMLIGQVLILPTIGALAELHAGPNGPLRLLYVFFLIFAADTGAYFAGRAFGKRKLAPAVSPGKSVEGAVGGLALCAVWALSGGVAVFHPGGKLPAFVLLSLLVAVVSIIGDLTESLFKRAAGVKDSGTILPGHGGILDRVDSLLAAAPVMALGLYVLEL